jgi:tellurite resistance protein TerC
MPTTLSTELWGAPLRWWLWFHLAVAVLVLVDASLPHSRSDRPRARLAWSWSLFVAAAAGLFAFWLNFALGHETALEFVSGYTIETSLSIDNLFVFLLLFKGFRLGHARQHRALMWGIAGAILLRAIFIALGVSLLAHFAWVSYVFGAILLYAAWRLVGTHSADNALPNWIRNLQTGARGLFWVIVCVEATDLLFAVDSIPAVLAISRNPFVVYTSNIAAILGLRSLFFALSSLLDQLRLLHFGLAALLAFVAIKMLIAHWLEIPIIPSLAIMATILLTTAIASLYLPTPKSS